MPGDVKTIAAATVDRFRAYQPLGSFGLISWGTRATAVRHLVVRFAVDNPVEGVVVVAVADGVTDGGERALFVLGSDHRLADRMDELGVPLRAKSGAAGANVLGEPLVVLKILGDRDPAFEFPRDLAIDVLEQAPALRQVLRVGTVDGANELGAVETEAVDVVFLEPHQGVIDEVLADLPSSVIRPCFSPRRVGPVVVVEVDSAAIVLAPAVELPEIEVAGAQVVVDHVEDHRDAFLMGTLDELLERQRAAVGGLHREDMGGVVAPRPVSGELADRHDLNRVDAKTLQMPQTRRHRGELARLVDVLLVVERADVKLVDDQLVPGGDVEVVPLPVEGRIVNDGVSDRVGYLAGIRVDSPELARSAWTGGNDTIAGMSLGDVSVPVTVLLGLHRMPGAIPLVEGSDDGDSLRVGRRHAEGDSSCVRDRSHTLDLCFIAHDWFLGGAGHLARPAIAGADAPALIPTNVAGPVRPFKGSTIRSRPTSRREAGPTGRREVP